MSFAENNHGLTREEERVAVRNMTQVERKLTKLEAEIDQIKLLMVQKKITIGLGQFSEKVYEQGVVCLHGNRLTAVPGEVKAIIWKFLDKEPDRISLALTCKQNMATFSGFKQGNLWKEKRKTVTKQMRLEMLLRLHRFMMTKNPKMEEWISTRRICTTCLKYVSKSRSICHLTAWGGRSEEYLRDDTVSLSQKLIEGPQCPACVNRKKFELASHKQAYKNLKTRLAKHHKWSAGVNRFE